MVVRPLIGYFRWSLSDPSGPTLEYVKSINTTYLAQIGLRPPPPSRERVDGYDSRSRERSCCTYCTVIL